MTMYDLDTVYDVTLPESPEEFEIFRGIYHAYSQAHPLPRSIEAQAAAAIRSRRMTASDAASTPSAANLDEVVARHSAQPKKE